MWLFYYIYDDNVVENNNKIATFFLFFGLNFECLRLKSNKKTKEKNKQIILYTTYKKNYKKMIIIFMFFLNIINNNKNTATYWFTKYENNPFKCWCAERELMEIFHFIIVVGMSWKFHSI